MRQALGTVQALQYVTLFSSVAGFGVTEATSVMIMGRLNDLGESIAKIESRISGHPTKRREQGLRSRQENAPFHGVCKCYRPVHA